VLNKVLYEHKKMAVINLHSQLPENLKSPQMMFQNST